MLAPDIFDEEMQRAIANEMANSGSAPLAEAAPAPAGPLMLRPPDIAPPPPVAMPRRTAPDVSGDNLTAARLIAMGAAIQGHDPGAAFGGAMRAVNDAAMSGYRNQAEMDSGDLSHALGTERLSEMQGSRAEREMNRQMARQAMDPQSQVSRERQAEYSAQMAARADIAAQSGMVDLAQTFAAEAERARTMSASQIERASGTFGGVLKESMGAADLRAKQDLARQGLDLKQRSTEAQETMARGNLGARYAEISDRREDRELRREERKDEAQRKRDEKLPSDGGVEKFLDREVVKKEIDRAIQLLPKVRYTGAGAETVNSVVSALPEALDPRNPEEREFISIINRLRAKERNKIFGAALSKYDLKDAASFLASLGTNPETIKQNLETLRMAVGDENASMEKLYPGVRKVAGESAPATLSPQDQKALDWANANPGDPRAAQIKQRLGAQ